MSFARSLLLLPVLLLGLVFPVWAEENENPAFFEDGGALPRGEGALLLYGGYPHAGLKLAASPWPYLNLGFMAQVDYSPAFALGALLKWQPLENEAKTLNAALTLTPAFNFMFDRKNVGVDFWVKPGFVAGWRMARFASWFLQGEYVLELPLSPALRFEHHPEVGMGFEFAVGSGVTLIAKGTTAFRHYNPEDFVYGGSFGVSFLLWR